MKIDTDDLITIIDILKNEIISAFPDGIEVDEEDFYWQFYDNEVYDPKNEPKVEMLGQLSEDWNELLRLKNNSEIAISYDLKRLAAILNIVDKKGDSIW